MDRVLLNKVHIIERCIKRIEEKINMVLNREKLRLAIPLGQIRSNSA